MSLCTPPAPAGFAPNADYTVRARLPGQPWQDVFVSPVLVLKEFHWNPQGHDDHEVSRASVASFDFAGRVEVEVRVNYAAATRAQVRPVHSAVEATVAGGTVRFTLDRPRQLVLSVNGDKGRELHLFANPPEENPPHAGDPNVTYFGPGIHELSPFEYQARSGETIYLAPGAVVRGSFVCDHVQNVTIRGRGIIDHMPQFTPGGRKGSRGIRIVHSSDVTVEGITILNTVHYHFFVGASRNVHIENTKSFSVSQWADGIDSMCSSDLAIRDVFVRASDDCIALYNSRWDFHGDSRNISVNGAVLWADVAHPIFMGCHGDPAGNDILERVRIRDVDILEHHEKNPQYQGCLAINAGDGVSVRDVVFDDIRIEPFTLGQLVNLRVFNNRDFNTAPGRSVSNIIFRDVRYEGRGENPSIIDGFDATRLVENVTFEGLAINGVTIADPASANIRVGPNTRDIRCAPGDGPASGLSPRKRHCY